MVQMSKKEEFVNPIDKDKVTDHPGLLPYAHQVGSAVIRPEDKGKIKGRAMSSMYEQTQAQLDQIKEQIELLAEQAQRIKDRMHISNLIYDASIAFEPLVGHHYYLYEKNDGSRLLSMVAPHDWGKKKPYIYMASVRLMADHTWEVTDQAQEIDIPI